MTRRLTRRLSAALVLCAVAAAAATPALAHPGHPGHEDLGAWAGFVHPFTGLDHMLAMFAVGLWAARRGDRAIVVWPATFLTAMAIGFNLPAINSAIPEAGVLVSVIVLGALTAWGHRRYAATGMAIVGLAGLMHGMAHVADIGQAPPTFELGMLAATAVLHGAGLGLGGVLRHLRRGDLMRWLGVGVAASGVAMAVVG